MEIYNKDLGKVCVTAEGNHIESESYERLSIVYDPIRRKSYLSKTDVPQGIHIDNTEYWQCIGSGKVNDDCIINLSYVNSDNELITYTLQEAINTVNVDDRRVGTLLTFFEKTEDITRQPGWALYQFNSININDWDNLNNWFPIYHNRAKFVGWYDTEEILKTNLPNPFIGSYAFVGNNLNISVIYRCKETGTWVATEELTRDFLEINITGNVTINKDGHWVVEDIDTGVSAVGVTAATAETTVLEPRENPSVEVSTKDIKKDLSKSLHFNFKLPKPIDTKITEVIANVQSINNKQSAECSVIKTGEADNTKLEFNFKIPEGKPAGFGTLTADIKMIEAGEEPSIIINKSGPNTAINLNFLFKLPTDSQISSYKTFTIIPTPSDATVTINDIERNSITVIEGTSVNWKVEKEGYITQQGSQNVNTDETKQITLVEIKPTNITNIQYTIESDSEIQDVTQIPPTGGIVKFKATGTVSYNDSSSKQNEPLNFGTYEVSSPALASINTFGDVVTVTFISNDSFTHDESIIIKFKYNNGSQDKTVNIFTAKVLKKEETLEVEPTTLEFEAEGGTKTIKVTSNTNWTIS